MTKKKLEVPKSSIRDYFDKATRIGIASADGFIALSSGISVPVSGPLLEFYNAFVQSPQQTRLVMLLEEIIEKLSELEANGRVTLEDIQNNDLFHSILIESTIVVRKTHNQQKKEMLKTAIIHTALGITIDDDSAVLFVRYIDELTPKHILLLRQLHSHPEPLKTIKGYEELYKLFSEEIGSPVSKDAFKFLCEDLATRGLIRISQFIDDFTDIYEPAYVVDGGSADQSRIRVTDLGNDFLAFVMVES